MKIHIFFIHIFTHIQASVNLQLQGIDVFARLAVVEGNKSPGIRAVKFYPVAVGFQRAAELFRYPGRTAFIKQSTQAEFHRLGFVHNIADFGRH